MNYAIILAAGVGQRMRSGGLPKQFLKLMGKPIVVYTLEKFENSPEVDRIIVVCHSAYIELMEDILHSYQLTKVTRIVVGGGERQNSLINGLDAVIRDGAKDDDIVIIHDGVRPLVTENTIRENVRVARASGCAITVHPVTESVIITDTDHVSMENFKKRADTYYLTAPQTFRVGDLKKLLMMKSCLRQRYHSWMRQWYMRRLVDELNWSKSRIIISR